MKPSGSTAGRAIACPASHALPGVIETGDYADRGTTIHAWLARAAMGENLTAPPECDGIDLTGILEGLSNIETEVSFAIDVSNGKVRRLGRMLERKYPKLSEWEISLTIDLIADDVVLDWKTGEDLGNVKDNWQMRLSSYAVATYHEYNTVRAWLAYIQPDGSIVTAAHSFDYLELSGYLEVIYNTLKRIKETEIQVANGETPTVVKGDHCKYCPAKSYCPAWTAMIKAMDSAIPSYKERFALMSPSQLANAYLTLKEYEGLVDTMLKNIRELAGDAMPLGNGYELKRFEQSRMYLDKDLARGTILKLGGSQEDLDKCNKKTTFPVYRKTRVK